MMDKDMILKQAQSGKDEREELITIKAHKFAGNLSLLVAALAAAAIIADGHLGNSGRSYDFLTVAAILMGVTSLNNLIFSIYQLVQLRATKRIVDIIVFGAICIWALKTVLVFFL